jgi:hypothetical protein
MANVKSVNLFFSRLIHSVPIITQYQSILVADALTLTNPFSLVVCNEPILN